MLIVAGCDMSKLHHYQYASVTPLRDYKFKDKRVVSYNIDVLEIDEDLAIWCEGSQERRSIALPRNRYLQPQPRRRRDLRVVPVLLGMGRLTCPDFHPFAGAEI